MDCNFAKWIDGMLLIGHMWASSQDVGPGGTGQHAARDCERAVRDLCRADSRRAGVTPEQVVWLFLAGNLHDLRRHDAFDVDALNKQLWTVPFAVFTSGMAFVVFACCLWLIDVQGWQRSRGRSRCTA